MAVVRFFLRSTLNYILLLVDLTLKRASSVKCLGFFRKKFVCHCKTGSLAGILSPVQKSLQKILRLDSMGAHKENCSPQAMSSPLLEVRDLDRKIAHRL